MVRTIDKSLSMSFSPVISVMKYFYSLLKRGIYGN